MPERYNPHLMVHLQNHCFFWQIIYLLCIIFDPKVSWQAVVLFIFQLEEHIQRLREELEREREERNYFQLERDKVNTFWEITKRQLEEKKAELRNKDREMEDSEERHQIEIKVLYRSRFDLMQCSDLMTR